MLKIPLKYRITIVLFSFSALVLIAINSQVLSQYYQGNKEQIVLNQRATLKLLGEFARIALLTSDFGAFQPQLEQVAKFPDVQEIIVADDQDIIVAASNPTRVGRPLLPTDTEEKPNWQTLTLKDAAGNVGTLVMKFSDDSYVALHKRIQRLAFAWSLASVLLLAAISIIAGHLLTRRLERITRSAAAVAQGDLSTPSNVTGNDEVAELSNVFDNMLDTIKAERTQLQEREQYLSLTLNSIGDAVITTNKSGDIERMNPIAEKLTGWTIDKAKGQPLKEVFQIVDATTRQFIENPVEKVIATGEVVYLSNHTTLIAKDGAEHQIADSAAPIRNDQGDIFGMVLVFNDVTEQYQLREAVAKSKRDLQAILDHSPAVIYVKDIEGRYIFINKQFEVLFDIGREAISGLTDYDIFPKDFADQFRRNDLNVIAEDRAIESEEFTRHKDGSLHSYIAVKFPLHDESGTPYATCGISTDITLRKHQEEQLRISSKMDALSKLTGGIAHDYNNLLGIIMGYAEQLNQQLKDDKLVNYADSIKHAAERGTKLTKKLLTFSKFKAPDFKVININTALEEQRLMLEKTLTSRITLNYDLAQDLWPVELDIGDLEDAIVNMSINAMHAIDDTGELTIQTLNKTLSKTESQSLNLSLGEYVFLTISDTGHGMDPQTKERIFDPFFTTKKDKGTGLGLSQVYGFMTRSHGSIHVESEINRGTRFELIFPRSHKSLTIQEASSTTKVLKEGNNEKILIVDDEPNLLQLTQEILTSHGYQAFAANNANKALAILEKEPIDLMITDVIMPQIDGYQLAERVQKKYPHIKIQLISGFTDNRHEKLAASELHKNILYKPYTTEALLNQLYLQLHRPNKELHDCSVLIMDDDDDVHTIFNVVFRSLGCPLYHAYSGNQAIDIYNRQLTKGEPIDAVIVDLTIHGGMGGKEFAQKIRAIDHNAHLIVSSGLQEGPEMRHYRDFGFDGALIKDFNPVTIKRVLETVILDAV